jgi:hypothetical protein
MLTKQQAINHLRKLYMTKPGINWNVFLNLIRLESNEDKFPNNLLEFFIRSGSHLPPFDISGFCAEYRLTLLKALGRFTDTLPTKDLQLYLYGWVLAIHPEIPRYHQIYGCFWNFDAFRLGQKDALK